MILDAWGWYTGMTPRDGTGREDGLDDGEEGQDWEQGDGLECVEKPWRCQKGQDGGPGDGVGNQTHEQGPSSASGSPAS